MADAEGQHVSNDAPRRAPVTPRVRTSPGSGALPLERLVAGMLDAGAAGVVFVHAPAGGGKTTALAHLRSALREHAARLHLLDEPKPADLRAHAGKLLVVTGSSRSHHDWLATLELVPWAEDEWIEYLAANHRPMVGSVMARLKDDATRHALDGSPQLWTIVLDALAADVSLTSARDALRHHLLSLLPDERARVAAGAVAVNVLGCDAGVLPPNRSKLPEEILSLLRHPVVRLRLAADWLATAFAAGGAPPVLLAQPLERDLLAEAGAALR
ncbi:MAG TPA: hypothetical protein VGR35_03345, partial [Tepidisphaeraceae bacterium]|nr:hypothetical protein [Tepidisphaeraceae bacterium]